ncbi:MAG: rhomboid family intramembrane serine protease [Deltaproteobacteria bacterium]|nr:rhomboid family intramembrane serine protease [Deltaproteobacteria bacterium]
MTPWRLGADRHWLDRCPSCDETWVERIDAAALERVGRQGAARAVYRSLGDGEKTALVQDLVAPEQERSLSPFHKALTFVGIPVVLGVSGERRPLATWTLAALLVACSRVSPDTGAYVVGSSGPLGLVSAGVVHFGAWHLLGNVAFLLSFGDALEQRLARPWYVAAFLAAAVLSTGAQALVTPDGVAIAGASGAVAAVIGAGAVLQPRARVAFRPVLWVGLQVPIRFFAAGWFLWQALMWLAGAQGVGWAAHLSGVMMGAGLGAVLRRANR